MSVWCCAGAMGTALSQQEECSADPAEPQPPTMAEFMRARRRKGGALCSLRRRLRRTPPPPPDREAAICRQLRGIVSGWSRAELAALLFVLRREAARGEAYNRADLARPSYRPGGLTSCWCDVMISWTGGSVPAHAFVLAARTQYWKYLGQELQQHRVVGLPAGCGAVSRGELLATLRLIYGNEQETVNNSDGCLGLDILDNSGDNNDEDVSHIPPPAALLTALGISRDTFANDMLRVRRDGLLVDCTVCVSSRRFPCHRAVLANASRYFRSVIGRSMGGTNVGGHSSLVVDPLILPPRFIHALLHCAYSNQVDISLIEPVSPPVAATSTGWGSAKGNKVAAADKLEDIFQLYEIAKFCEMERCAMLCEELAVNAITVQNVGVAIRWARQSHASEYVLRGAMRFVRGALVEVVCAASASVSASASAGVSVSASACVLWAVRRALSSGAALCACSDDSAARALIHHYRHRHTHAARALHAESPWGRSNSDSTTSLKQFMAPFLPHIRTEHLPANHPLFTLGVCERVCAEPKDAWLGRGVWRPPRPLPAYLHTIQALVDPTSVSEAEVQEVLRANTMPDTLYMVGGTGGRSSDSSSVSSLAAESWSALETDLVRRLWTRVCTLVRQHPAALQHDTALHKHYTVMAAREMGVSVSSAVAALAHLPHDTHAHGTLHGAHAGHCAHCAHCGDTALHNHDAAISCEEVTTSRDTTKECCDRLEGSGAEVCALPSERTSLRLHSSRDSVGRGRELAGVVVSEGHGVPGAVPDVAAPDGNTHLLYPATGPVGRVLTLDLGDGATHAPARGSRAHRAMRSQGDGQVFDRERSSATECSSELDLPDAAAYQPRRLIPSPTYNPHPRSQHLSLRHTAFTLNPYSKNSNIYGEGSLNRDIDDNFGHEKYLNTGKNETFGKNDTFGHEKYLNSGKNDTFGHENYLNSGKSETFVHENYEKVNIPCPTEFETSHNRHRNNHLDCETRDYLQDIDDAEMYEISSNIHSEMGTYRDLKTQSELYNTKRNIETNLDYIERKNHCHFDTDSKRSHTNSLQRNFRHKSNTLELYNSDLYKGQGTSKEDRKIKASDYINCTLPKNCSNSKRNSNQGYSGLPTECFTEKEYYTKGDFLNKNLRSKDIYKDSKSIDPYQEFRTEQRLKEREKTKLNQSYNIDNIELKSLKIHCDSYISSKDYNTGSLKIHKGKNTQNLATKNISKDYNTLNTRIDSCGSISSHGTLMPRSNSSLSGRNSAQSSQSSHLSGQSSHISGQSSHISGQSSHISGQSGHISGQSSYISAQTGHHSVTGRSSPHSGVFNNSSLSSIGNSTPTHLLASFTPQCVNLGVNTQNSTPTHFAVPKSHGSPHSLSHKYQSEVSHSTSLDCVGRDGMSPRSNVSPRDSVSSRDGLSDRDRASPRHVMSTRDLSSRDISSRDTMSTRDMSTRDTMSTRDMSTRDMSTRDAVSTREMSSRDMTSRDVMSTREKSTRDTMPMQDRILRDPMSSRDIMSSRDAMSLRDATSIRDVTSSQHNTTTRDVSPRDRTPRDGMSTRDIISRDISRDMSPRDVERVRHALPGHVRPRSKDREQVFTLHTAHPSHPSDSKSTNLYRVGATDIGRTRSPPHNHS